MAFLGIDVGGTKIQGAYLQQQNITLTQKLATPTSSYETFLATLTVLVETARQACGELRCVGIGIPGQVEEDLVQWVPNLPFLNGKRLTEDLTARINTPVCMANDAHLALLGEAWQGAARNRHNVVLISVGTGVGGAVMLNGKIVQGAHGSAGAFGWLKLDWQAPSHPEHGYVEQHAAGSALDQLARQLDPSINARELVARARDGHPASLAIIQRIGVILGTACASITSILDPEIVIFTGGLADAFDLFAPIMQTTLAQTGSPGARTTPIVVAQSGKYAGVYGALRAAMLDRQSWLA